MEEEQTDSIEKTDAPPEEAFITITVKGDGQYAVSSNLGDAWALHVLKLAKKLREDLM